MIADKPICLVDLDGIILEHDQEDGDGFDEKHFGPVREGTREGLEKLEELGYLVVVWTTRSNVREIMQYLEEEDIESYDYVNVHPHQPRDASAKLYADLIIDDRGLGCPTSWDKIIEMVEEEVGADG